MALNLSNFLKLVPREEKKKRKKLTRSAAATVPLPSSNSGPTLPTINETATSSTDSVSTHGDITKQSPHKRDLSQGRDDAPPVHSPGSSHPPTPTSSNAMMSKAVMPQSDSVSISISMSEDAESARSNARDSSRSLKKSPRSNKISSRATSSESPSTPSTPSTPSSLSDLSPKPTKGIESLSQFQQEETLGYGTFGCVHRVTAKATGQSFACKVLSKAKVVKKKQVQHLKSERNLLMSCNSPFVIKMHASFVDTRNIYLLLEYVDGGELFHLLRRSGRLSTEATVFYSGEVVLALEYLHSYKIAFRDLKPENILLNRDGNAKLCDFGFAKTVSDRTWTLCGTPEYLAPEVITGIGHDCAVDWWAVGVLIFEMLAGYPPFYGEHPFEIYEKICDCTYRFPSTFDMVTKDVISRFLVPQKHLRLGSSGGGVTMIKKHAFYQSLDWKKLARLQLAPPLTPPVPTKMPPTFFRERVSQYDEYALNRTQTDDDGAQFEELFREFAMAH